MKFEETLRQLDEALRNLEDGDLTLDEALDLFERGVGLVREAGKFLDEAEQKITLLTQDGEEVAFKPH
jgi:exodeoxyribonuclease VII small subunit